LAFLAVALLLLLPVKVQASAFFYYFGNSFSGTAPSGSAPWISALFEDVSPGTVSLTISNNNLAVDEFVREVDFNLKPSLSPTSLLFTYTGSSGTFALPTILQGTDIKKADGDGKYDISLGFSTEIALRFGPGESLTYQITGIPTLTVADFIYYSTPAGGHGPFYAASHIQGISGGTLSGWVSPLEVTPVPEPSSFVLLALVGGVWAARRRILAGN